LLAEHIELIYYGSLIQRTQAGFTTIQELLNRKPPGTKCLYDMNLRLKSYNTTAVLKSLEHANILKLSETELEITRRMLGNTLRVVKFIKHLMKTFDIEMVALTKGKNGCELYTKNTRNNIKGFAVDDVVDSVGAAMHMPPCWQRVTSMAGHLKRFCQMPPGWPHRFAESKGPYL